MKATRYFAMREAVLSAGEVYCAEADPKSSVGVMCSRPAGHRGRHAVHGTDPDRPMWTWPRAPAGGGDAGRDGR